MFTQFFGCTLKTCIAISNFTSTAHVHVLDHSVVNMMCFSETEYSR